MKLDQTAKYTKEHEWARQEGDLIIVGITDHAQDQLGDVVYAELPEIGQTFDKDEEFGVVESVKAVSPLYVPMSGGVVEVNESLSETPEMINDDPYGEGWILKLSPSKPSEWETLLSGEDYEQSVEAEH